MTDIKNDLQTIRNYRKTGHLNMAQKITSDLLKIYPTNPIILLEQAMIYKYMHNYESALMVLNTLLHTPKRNIALMEIGNIHTIQNKYYDANNAYLTLYNESLDKQDTQVSYNDKVLPLQKTITNMRKRGLRKEALKYIDLLIEILNHSFFANDHDRFFALNELALINASCGQVNEALEKYYEIYESGYYNDKQIALSEMAAIYFNDHKPDIARICLEKINNTNFELKNNYLLGKIEFMEQNYSKAIAIFEHQLNTKNHRLALDRLICLHFKNLQFRKAEAYIYEILKLFRPTDCRLDRYYSMLDVIRHQKEYFNQNYNATYATQMIEKKYISNPTVRLNIPLQELMDTIQTDKSNYYDSDKYDNYIVYIPNVGFIKDDTTDFVKVTTLINTSNIVGIYPCRSLNKQLHHEDTIVYKRTIEK